MSNYIFEPVKPVVETKFGKLRGVTYGDVNDDGDVNVRDYGLLQQHLNDWDVSLFESACDVTGDGEVNVRDYGLLQQYLNDWDVTLK